MRWLPSLLLAACTGGGSINTHDDSATPDSPVDTDPAACAQYTGAIVTDIDETLTTADGELWKQVADSHYDPAMRPDANTLMQGYAAKGWTIMYITARGEDTPMTDHRSMRGITEQWLADHGFPYTSDHVYLATGLGVFGSSASTYKAGVVTDLQTQGWTVGWGYGNADTDITGFEAGGVPAEDLFLVGKLAGTMGVTGIPDSDAYTAHLSFLTSVPEAPCAD